jgi:ribonuclease Z
MKLFPMLLNAEYQDPVLTVSIPQKTEMILFDLGYCFRLKLKDIKKITRIFISHTHIDHFAGFDHVLRLSLDLDKTVYIYGPPGIINNVNGKLSSYTWNLTAGVHINFSVFEIRKDRILNKVFMGNNGFENTCSPIEYPIATSGLICQTNDYNVRCAFLEHKIPVLSYRIDAVDSYNADVEIINSLGLTPGKWVGDVKEAASKGSNVPVVIDIEGKEFSTDMLKEKIIKKTAGTSIVYIVDTIYDEDTSQTMKELAKGADYLFCETSYLFSELSLAVLNCHMTALQAGYLARDSEVKKLIPIHFSRRYEGEYQKIYEEAKSVFPNVEKAVKYE